MPIIGGSNPITLLLRPVEGHIDPPGSVFIAAETGIGASAEESESRRLIQHIAAGRLQEIEELLITTGLGKALCLS